VEGKQLDHKCTSAKTLMHGTRINGLLALHCKVASRS